MGEGKCEGFLNKISLSTTKYKPVIPAQAGIQSLLRPHLILYVLLLLLVTACGSNQHASHDTGSISFKLQLSHPTTTSRAAAALPADICTDYGITTINVNVFNSSGAAVAAGNWSCSAHEGIITDVPAGSNYTIRITGTATGGIVAWRGEKGGVGVTAGSTTSAGTITMAYTGSDATPPSITSSSPSIDATGVPVTSAVTAIFSENMAASSINTTTFTLKQDATPVSGSVDYDTGTLRAIFIPSSNLSYSTTYTATLTKDLEDMAGNNLESDYSWTFTTEDPPTTLPSAPTGIVAASGNSQITITWDAVPAATSYNIYWSSTSGVTKTTGTKISDITTTSYTHTGLTNGTIYYYVVTSLNSYGESVESYEISSAPGSTDATPPTGSITINNNAVYTTTTAVTLSLSSSSTRGISHMCISNTTTCSSWEPYTTSKSWTLTTGDGIRFVYAWFKDGTGTSNTTPYFASITLDTTPPSDGTLTATTGNDQVSLTWNGFSDAISGIGGYKLVYSISSSPDTCSSGTQVYSGSDTSYTHTSLTNGTTYYYRVCADDNAGNVSAGASVSAIPNPPARIPKTGQTASYAAGDDGDLQRGVAWPSPRFTVGTGIETDCVIDNLTGLMWKNNPGYAGRTWQEAFDDANNLSLCGYRDWRLPNINEIMSLINVSEPDTTQWVNNQGFYGVYSGYWSSTSDASRSDYTWVSGGRYMESYNKDSVGGHAVWPVRSVQTLTSGYLAPLPRTGQTTCYDYSGNVITCAGTGQDGEIQAGVAWPSPRFKVSTDGYCVTDNLTGLMWVRSPDSVTRTWQEALDFANNVSLCGYTDWLLPNINELRSLINAGEPDTAQWLNNQGFSNVHEYYWSSTNNAEDSRFAWFISMYNGNLDIYAKSASMYYAWPVRSGQ